MNPSVRSIVLLTIASASLIAFASLGGCEDADAKQRDTVQAQIHQANLKMQKAFATAGDDVAAAKAFNGVVGDLAQVTGGEPGQQAAKSTLAATALREIALIKLGDAEEIESSQAQARLVLDTQLDAVHRMTQMAQAVGSVDAAAQRQRLKADLASTKEQVAQLRTKIDQMDGPISEQSAVNANAKKEVDALRAKVTDLRRQAQQLGHADGFPTYEQAIATGRQADKIEYGISHREIELDYALTPELVMTDTYARQLDEMIKAIESTIADLETFAAAAAAQVATTQGQIKEVTTSITASLGQLEAQSKGDLATAYDEAQAALDKAASQIRQVKGGDAQYAKLTAAQIQVTIGRLNWSKARGLISQKSLLENVKAAGIAAANIDTAAITAAHQTAIEAAKSAFASAQELLTSVQSRTNQAAVDSYTHSIESALAAIENKPAAPAAPDSGNPNAGSSESASATSETGADSPEVLVEYLKSIKTVADLGRVLDLTMPLREVTGLTPATRQMGEGLKSLIGGVAALDTSLGAKFGKSVADLSKGGKGAFGGKDIPTVKDAVLQDVQGIRGTILITPDKGSPETVRITQVNDRWYLGSENDAIDGMGWLMGSNEFAAMTRPSAGADPQAQQMAQGMIQMMGKMFGAVGGAMKAMAQSIDHGDFASFDDFKSKFEESLKKVGEEAMGGAGGLGGLGAGGLGGISPPEK